MTLDLVRSLLDEVAADEVSALRLRRVLRQWQTKPIPVSVLTETLLPPPKTPPSKTQRFIEFLQEIPGQQA